MLLLMLVLLLSNICWDKVNTAGVVGALKPALCHITHEFVMHGHLCGKDFVVREEHAEGCGQVFPRVQNCGWCVWITGIICSKEAFLQRALAVLLPQLAGNLITAMLRRDEGVVIREVNGVELGLECKCWVGFEEANEVIPRSKIHRVVVRFQPPIQRDLIKDGVQWAGVATI